jgi:hypothetical protein
MVLQDESAVFGVTTVPHLVPDSWKADGTSNAKHLGFRMLWSTFLHDHAQTPSTRHRLAIDTPSGRYQDATRTPPGQGLRLGRLADASDGDTRRPRSLSVAGH